MSAGKTANAMKRTSETPDLESGRGKSFRRQDPVSCQFCRRKKLKCDRGAPCSNCRARKVTCSSAIDGQPIQDSRPADQSPPGGIESNQHIEELNARVRKLEELLTRKNSIDHASSRSTHPGPAPEDTRRDHPLDAELTNAVSWLETDAFEHTASAPTEQSQLDAKVAESFGSFIFSLTRPRNAPAMTLNLENLPSQSQGEVMIDYYFSHVNWIYQIVHEPTVRQRFDSLYTSLFYGTDIKHDHLALISTIFALSAYFSGPMSGLHFKHSEAMLYSRKYTLLAQEALSAANCLSMPTIEGLQSLILISQHMMPNIGAIATLRTLAATIMHTARAMSLHQIDSSKNKRLRESVPVDYADLEVKRRIWWHIASTDWLLSFMSGAQCGTYMIHPKQMIVDYPTNVNDDGIIPSGNYALPSETPTEMTYFIFRIRFATLFREMVDSAWESGCDMDEISYDLVLEFDKRLNNVSADFERAWSSIMKQSTSRIEGDAPDRRTTLLAKQRSMAQFGMHTRFARLHRPYLVRGVQDPRYTYSRMVCLRSARTVIEIGKAMTVSSQDFSSMKIWSLNHHVFVSAVILVMDFCFNREEPRAKERKEEIMDCFRVLERSKDESTIATRGLQKLRNLLSEGSGGRDQITKAQSSRPAEQVPPPLASSMDASGKYNAQPPIPPRSLEPLPLLPMRYSNFGMPPVQDTWADFEYFSSDNFNFNVDLDASQFEALFQNIDGQQYA